MLTALAIRQILLIPGLHNWDGVLWYPGRSVSGALGRTGTRNTFVQHYIKMIPDLNAVYASSKACNCKSSADSR